MSTVSYAYNKPNLQNINRKIKVSNQGVAGLGTRRYKPRYKQSFLLQFLTVTNFDKTVIMKLKKKGNFFLIKKK